MVDGSHWNAIGPGSAGFETKPATFGVGGVFLGVDAGVIATCDGGDGDGVLGTGRGQYFAGVEGTSNTVGGNGVIATAHNGTQAYGLWARSDSGYAARFDGKVYINGDFQVTGTKGAVVRAADGTYRGMFAVEAPESWFEDFGFGRLVDGRADVLLDPQFAELVREEGPYHVFLTEYGAGGGLFVTDRTSGGFAVRAASEDAGDREFGYRVVARRKGVAQERFAVLRDATEGKEAPREPRVPGAEAY
ncbi:hypothetical protein ACFQ9Q_11865 [Streptomyces virginiae]|uniref:hypothetical protein n=1 Tax=Streptomyces virginiae TaxID=1961 RepID=UPI0036997A76